MKLYFVLLNSISGIVLQEINCYTFDDKNETMKLNENCDKGDETMTEGNIGQAGVFPWLGILRAHIHKHNSFQIAVTGVVLIKDKFAIGNANDISRLSRKVMKTDCKVMFITADDKPWFCQVVDYTTHPEIEITTLNTVALVELRFNLHSRDTVHPICWPYKNFNTSNQLYAIGYTDEHQLLEKTVYKLEYVDKTLCSEFYKRSNFSEKGNLTLPLNYICAYSVHSKQSCFWDTGMVVASNVSGQWTLIGLVIGGGGCAAPARFLNTIVYLPWLITTMDLDSDEWTS